MFSSSHCKLLERRKTLHQEDHWLRELGMTHCVAPFGPEVWGTFFRMPLGFWCDPERDCCGRSSERDITVRWNLMQKVEGQEGTACRTVRSCCHPLRVNIGKNKQIPVVAPVGVLPCVNKLFTYNVPEWKGSLSNIGWNWYYLVDSATLFFV